MGIIKDCFYNTKEMTEKDYRRAKLGFIIDDAMSNGAYNLVGGSYFVAVLAYIGASEALSNFILSFALLGGFFQILVPAINKRMRFKKPFVFLCKFFDRMPMALIFFVPFVFGKGTLSVVMVGILALIAFVFTYFMSPVHSAWLMDCLDGSSGVGKFYGIKIGVANGCVVVMYLLAAKIMSVFSGERQCFAFLWLGGIAFVMWIVVMVTVTVTKEPYKKSSEEKAEEQQIGIIDGFKVVFTHKKMRPYLAYNTIYYTGLYLMNSLVSVMCVQRLKMSLEILSYLTMSDYVIRLIFAPVFGKITDKAGAKTIVACGVVTLALSFVLHAFMTSENVVILKIIAVFISSIAWAMLGASQNVFQLESLPEDKRTSCLACVSSLFFLVGTVANWITTWFISVANGLNVNIFGIEFSEMGIVFIIGSLICVLASVPVIRANKKSTIKN